MGGYVCWFWEVQQSCDDGSVDLSRVRGPKLEQMEVDLGDIWALYQYYTRIAHFKRCMRYKG